MCVQVMKTSMGEREDTGEGAGGDIHLCYLFGHRLTGAPSMQRHYVVMIKLPSY